jgi:hypothetical protein
MSKTRSGTSYKATNLPAAALKRKRRVVKEKALSTVIDRLPEKAKEIENVDENRQILPSTFIDYHLSEKALERGSVDENRQNLPSTSFDDQLLTIDQIRQRDELRDYDYNPDFQFEYDETNNKDPVRESDIEYSSEKEEDNFFYKLEDERIEVNHPSSTRSSTEKIFPGENKEPPKILIEEQIEKVTQSSSHSNSNGKDRASIVDIIKENLDDATMIKINLIMEEAEKNRVRGGSSLKSTTDLNMAISPSICPSKSLQQPQLKSTKNQIKHVTPIAIYSSQSHQQAQPPIHVNQMTPVVTHKGNIQEGSQGTIDKYFTYRGFTDNSICSQVVDVASITNQMKVPLIRRWDDCTTRSSGLSIAQREQIERNRVSALEKKNKL